MADPALDDEDFPGLGPEARVKTISIDVPVEDLEWCERYSEYRNAIAATLASEEGSKVHRRNSRKAMIELAVRKVAATQQAKMKDIVAMFGPLPPASEKAAVQKYADRVLAKFKKLLNSQRG